MFVRRLFDIFRVPYIVKDDVFAVLVARDDTAIAAEERNVVEPVKVVGRPLIEETVRACVETAIEYVIPETWRRACGVDVAIPTYPVLAIRMVSESA